MRRLSRIALALALGSLLLALPQSAAANSFDVTCTSSHVANDDPIVFPGKPGAAHRHEFFGAKNTDARSTTASLRRARTTCGDRADTAAYWAPTLEVNGKLVTGTLRAYYQRNGKRSAAAPPQGLRMIAGSAKATRAQSMRVTAWQCIGKGRHRQFNAVPACRRGERLASWVRFPDCWNGRDLDSSDHVSHVAYSAKGACPATHPVAMMRVAFLISWPVRPRRASQVSLGGGMLAPHAFHADFWNAWRQPRLQQLRWDCIEVARPCGSIDQPPIVVVRTKPAATRVAYAPTRFTDAARCACACGGCA